MSDDGSGPLAAVAAAESTVRPVVEDQLRAAVESEPAVADALRAWDALGGPVPDTEAVARAAARQATVLTNHVRYRVAVGRDPPAGLRATPVRPFRHLDEPPAVDAALDDLRTALDRRGGRPADDLLGRRYGRALPDAERRARGQFYTPPAVAGLVTRWALDGVGDRPRVLDPAAGTGTFPVAAYAHCRSQAPDADPDALVSRLVAVDVDDVALHVAALRCAALAGGAPAGTLDTRAGSFFDLEPGDVAPVDAVVGNPPFVRAGDLVPDREHFRAHLRGMCPPGTDGPSYADGDRALSRRSDASVYFVTHATRFLRPGGRLGVVLPAKWLESDYGVGFRRFLAEHYRVHAVVGFGTRAFDALVDTVLLLAERRDGAGADESPVSFVRLAGLPGPTDDLAGLPTEPGGADPPQWTDDTDRDRVVRRPQATFAGARQCSPYLRAPEELLAILDDSGFVPLGDLASVSRGVTTGANRFFLLDPDECERWGFDPAVLRPALRSIRGVTARTLSAADVEQSMLAVHGVLTDSLGGDWGPDPTAVAKRALREAGHDAVVDYVEAAEGRGWHEGRTCQARRVWFDLGPVPTPDAFVPKLLRERVFTVRNRAGAVPSNAIDCVSARDGVDAAVLLGVLDSSLVRALMEVWGRDEAGMLQLMTYETRTLPVPDVRSFTATEAAAVREAAADLGTGGDAPDATDRGPDAQRALDAAVLAPMDLDVDPAGVRELRERLLRRRVGDDSLEAPVTGD